MAGIDLNTVQQDLARRFAAPLPEFYKRRIIFWYDEDREFEDQLDGLLFDGVKIVALTGSNTFAVKKLLDSLMVLLFLLMVVSTHIVVYKKVGSIPIFFTYFM